MNEVNEMTLPELEREVKAIKATSKNIVVTIEAHEKLSHGIQKIMERTSKAIAPCFTKANEALSRLNAMRAADRDKLERR